MDVPLKNFSSGMNARLAFAVAANLVPDLLLIDEVFAVGDADFQRRCAATMREFCERGCTIMFVSHGPGAVRDICNRAAVLDAGQVVFDGDVDAALTHYSNLVAADPIGALPGADARPGPGEYGTTAAHRAAMSHWEELGPWALDFLRRAGLTRESVVLDMGCGSLPVTIALLPALDLSRYWGYEFDRELFDRGILVEMMNRGLQPERGHFIINDRFDLSESPYVFNFALAHSLSGRLSAERFGVAVAAVVGHLAPGGQFFLSVGAEQKEHLSVVGRVCATIRATTEPREDAGHPRGDLVWRIVRQESP